MKTIIKTIIFIVVFSTTCYGTTEGEKYSTYRSEEKTCYIQDDINICNLEPSVPKEASFEDDIIYISVDLLSPKTPCVADFSDTENNN